MDASDHQPSAPVGSSQALCATATRDGAIVALIPDALLCLCGDGRISDTRAFAEFAHPLPLADWIGHRPSTVLPPATAQTLADCIGRARAALRPQSCELQVLDGGGQTREFDAYVVPDEKDHTLVLLRDAAERRRLDRWVLEISEGEQRRIGQDLHDGLGQQLTAIAFLAKILERKLIAGADDPRPDVAEIIRQVNRAIVEMRALAKGLCPVNLEVCGLPAALEDLAAGTQARFDFKCRVEADREATVPAVTDADHLFRIAQEAVRNAVQHSGGREIAVRLVRRGNAVVLEVKDDGVGISENLDPRKGMGLHLLRSRAKMIGATLEVVRAREGGTRVTCILPDATSGP